MLARPAMPSRQPVKCTYIKLTGEVCGRNHGARYAFCAAHRPRPVSRPFHPCSKCGKRTRLTSEKTGEPLCPQRSCGMYEYQAAYQRRKRAKDREEATARIEAAKKELEAREMDAYVEELLADFDPALAAPRLRLLASTVVAPPPPPPAWSALSEEAKTALSQWFALKAQTTRDPPDAPSACSAVSAC